MEFAAEGDGSARLADGQGGVKARLKLRELAEGLFDRGELAARDEGNAYLAGGDRSYVGLGVVGPVDLDLTRPLLRGRRYGEVLAEPDAAGGDGTAVERGEGANAGLVAVGADDEARMDGLTVCADGGADIC